MSYNGRHTLPKKVGSFKRRAIASAIGAASVAGGLAMAAPANAATSQASANVWDRVAACESGGNWSINTGNGFYGGLQFTRQTWLGFGGGRYASTANYASKAQQIEIAKKVLAVQGPGAWPVCSVRAGLTRASGGAASSSSSSYSSTASRSTTRTASSVSHTLYYNSRYTSEVRALQAALNRNGARIAVDGVFGPNTRRAVINFQKRKGLAVDGIVGAATGGRLGIWR